VWILQRKWYWTELPRFFNRHFQPNDTLNSVDLPVNANAATTTFTFNFRGAASKTLHLIVPRSEKTLSETCGKQVLFSDLAVVSTNFATVLLKMTAPRTFP
jgi:hypothetical protein